MRKAALVSFGIFIVFVSVGIFMKTDNSKYSRVQFVGVNLDNLIMPIDPINNPTLTNAFFSNNLYSNIVDVDSENNYVLDLASNYWFNESKNEVYFEFNQSRVTAEDAAFSLRRVVLQKLNLHSDLWQLLCAPEESRQSCQARIYVTDGRLILKYSKPELASSIIPTLASVDYKIVPMAAFDSTDPFSAKIINYSHTSGHYTLEINGSSYTLKKNSRSNIENIYNGFEIVNTNTSLLGDKATLDKLDIISTTVPITEPQLELLTKAGWEIFSSHNISVAMLVFSKNGRNKTSPLQRFKIAQIISTELSKNRIANSRTSIEFFQDFGQGFLSDAQAKEIILLRESKSEVPNGISLGVRTPSKWAIFEKQHPQIKIESLQASATTLNDADKPDIFLVTNDVSFDLNLSLISYAKNLELLKMDDNQLLEFINLKTDQDKVKFINEVHFETLKECFIYPIWTSPYFSAFKNNHAHELSKFNSRTILWKIH